MTIKILVGLFIALILYLLFRPRGIKSGFDVPKVFPERWRLYLLKEVNFYASLSEEDKAIFEADILRFLKRVRITGIKTKVADEDRLLVGSSAVIPVFAFAEWEYSSLHEVLLYPDLFTEKYDFSEQGRTISGMVGSGGVMHHVVIFSKPALHQGFDNASDKMNVGIHEFVHLFDKQDGEIDGIPHTIMKNQAVLPWLHLISENTKEMLAGKSDINIYGATNKREFLAVASEYFFERPRLFKEKHPELYAVLSSVFQTDLANSQVGDNKRRRTIGRNDPCPCGSGKKFKDCCMKYD
ncbi:zinc-dependent peptidase [Algoriphagus persicinus]|uniref:zinc-dependent peptidase n=1 Tax=Algoriphagus persicinus TaxID=3108754 RepID=UPI002B37D251|nr:zinc-dependent peptidase [Algoriphagus sp. E1-3-M2]MEB2786006.1 zinc-dependent peptidase [Algoriphagus sp. E1-3-M2]